MDDERDVALDLQAGEQPVEVAAVLDERVGVRSGVGNRGRVAHTDEIGDQRARAS